MNADQLVIELDVAWDDGGFLEGLRRGVYAPSEGQRFLALLSSVIIEDDEMIPKKLLSQIWYLPSFLEWQAERIAAAGKNLEDYRRFITEIHNTLERVIGVP